MPTLHELQAAFADAILNSTTRFVEKQVVNLPRLQIYRNNIFIKHTATLKIVYPAIVKLVGENFFNYAADSYINAYLANSHSLNDFGQHFADFLATFPAAAHLLYLPDVARLEWCSHQVYHAADHPLLDVTQLQTIPAEKQALIKFQLHPAAQLFTSDFPILRIWQMCQKENTDDAAIDLAEGGIKLLVIRRDYEVLFEPLSDVEFTFLSTFSQQQNFADACANTLAISANFDIAQCLQQNITRGTIVDFSFT
jgi:hypothetical protein